MNSPDTPDKRPTGPRRGAKPTPKDIIEKATPFVPDAPADPAPKPAPPKPEDD